MADIIKRWNERVVPNGWHKMGVEGAKSYLEKYGKNISNQKLYAFADYANSLGLTDFADGMLGSIKSDWKEFTREQAENLQDFPLDAIDFYNDNPDSNPILFEANINELGNRGFGTFCGDVGNTCFVKLAEHFPNLLVRGAFCLEDGVPTTTSVYIKISSEQQGEKLSKLAVEYGGCLRCDYTGESWTYFENE